MAKEIWVTVNQMAEFKQVKRAAVTNWIRRKQISSKKDEKYNITVVDRNSLTTKPREKSKS